jgi:hypothetical protein
MSLVTLDVPYTEPRNRLTNAFRWILAIPHLILAGVWGYAAELVAVVQWFIILFTGRRNQGIWDFQRSWFDYSARVTAYTYHLFDQYPAFGTDPGTVPVTIGLQDEEPANRLTNGLRIIWAIPAIVIGFFVGIAVGVVLFITWFAILFTGKHPKGMFDFTLDGLRYSLQLSAYALLMTDTYPKWGTGAGVPAARPAGGGSPLPPPPGFGTAGTMAPPTGPPA